MNDEFGESSLENTWADYLNKVSLSKFPLEGNGLHASL